MKLLGIDYGLKRVGVAIADSETGIAFPKAVIPNNRYLLSEIKDICAKDKIGKIIIGESNDLSGMPNKIMDGTGAFKKMLEADLQIDVVYEPEFYTSLQASRIQGEHDMIDASAAAIILQSYLDKYKTNGKDII